MFSATDLVRGAVASIGAARRRTSRQGSDLGPVRGLDQAAALHAGDVGREGRCTARELAELATAPPAPGLALLGNAQVAPTAVCLAYLAVAGAKVPGGAVLGPGGAAGRTAAVG